MYPLSARVRNQPPHSLLDRRSRISMITVRLQRLCFPALISLSKIGGAHSHVLLAEGAGCVSVGGLACLTSREARLNVAGRKSKTSNTAHQGSYHVRIYIYDVSIITILLCFCYRQNTSSSTLTYKLTWSLLTSSFLPPSFSTDPLPPNSSSSRHSLPASKMNYAPVNPETEEFTPAHDEPKDCCTRCIQRIDCTLAGPWCIESIIACFASMSSCFGDACSNCGDCCGECCAGCCKAFT